MFDRFRALQPKQLVAAIGGLLLFGFGLNQAVSGLSYQSWWDTREALGNGEELSEDDMRAAIAGLGGGLSALNPAMVHDDIGSFYVILAGKLDAGEQIAALEAARAAFATSVALAPGNPFPWMRLAVARFERDPSDPLAADALKLSLLTGTYRQEALVTRFHLGMRLWDRLDAQTQDAVIHQGRTAWTRRGLRNDIIRYWIGAPQPARLAFFNAFPEDEVPELDTWVRRYLDRAKKART